MDGRMEKWINRLVDMIGLDDGCVGGWMGG